MPTPQEYYSELWLELVEVVEEYRKSKAEWLELLGEAFVMMKNTKDEKEAIKGEARREIVLETLVLESHLFDWRVNSIGRQISTIRDHYGDLGIPNKPETDSLFDDDIRPFWFVRDAKQ